MASRLLVTHALPYANGSLHLGHLVESVQTDVFVRAMKAMGKECRFICADDTHGTPIEISAQKAGVPPEAFVERIHREHASDYQAFAIDFDLDRKSTRLNSSHLVISYAVFCLKKTRTASSKL